VMVISRLLFHLCLKIIFMIVLRMSWLESFSRFSSVLITRRGLISSSSSSSSSSAWMFTKHHHTGSSTDTGIDDATRVIDHPVATTRVVDHPVKMTNVIAQPIPMNYSESSFVSKMKEFKQISSPKKVLKWVIDYSNAGYLSQNMYLLSLKTLIRINNSDLCPTIYPHWIKSIDSMDCHNGIDFNTTISINRIYCKLRHMDTAEMMAVRLGLDIDSIDLRDMSPSTDHPSPPKHDRSYVSSTELQQFYGTILSDLAFGFICMGSYTKSLKALSEMKNRGIDIELEVSKRIFKQYLHVTKPDIIRRALRLLLSINGLDDNDSIQLVTNTYLRSVDFIKGAVSIDTLPPPLHNEVAFIGKGNTTQLISIYIYQSTLK